MKSNVQVVFFGTGPVAAKSLELLAQHTEVEAVVTKPKPDHHRGNYPVIDVAKKLKLPVHYVSSKTDVTNLFEKATFKSALGVLIDFGIIITHDVINYFTYGIINSHFSLLPQWRGADPITFSILSGQKKTGVSLMILVEAMDEGPILAISEVKLSGSETTPQLTDLLIQTSDDLLKNETIRYISGEAIPIPQNELDSHFKNYSTNPTYSRKLTKEDGRIDWNVPAIELERQIRAFTHWPKSYATLGHIDVIITQALVHTASDCVPGTVVIEDKKLLVHTAENWLEIVEIQPAGKKPMPASAFIAGYGSRLGVK